MDKKNFELPKKIETILASLSQYYRRQSNQLLQEVVVNSQYHVTAEWDYDNWDGGQSGHALHLQLPAEIYYEVLEEQDDIVRRIGEDANKMANVPHEHIAAVFLELKEEPSLENWRQDSGVLLPDASVTVAITDSDLDRIWHPGFLRVFVSHKSQIKKEAIQLKDALDYYGVSGFVAHEDIQPTKKWQEEIEKAVFSMEVMVPLLSKNFSESDWTDQEIGIAVGRRVPVIPVRLGRDPYGFIGKYQALSGNGKPIPRLAKEIYELLFQQAPLHARVVESLVTCFETSRGYYQANALMGYLERLDTTTPAIIERLERAPENNNQVGGRMT